jgi:hypothetical protein
MFTNGELAFILFTTIDEPSPNDTFTFVLHPGVTWSINTVIGKPAVVLNTLVYGPDTGSLGSERV